MKNSSVLFVALLGSLALLCSCSFTQVGSASTSKAWTEVAPGLYQSGQSPQGFGTIVYSTNVHVHVYQTCKQAYWVSLNLQLHTRFAVDAYFRVKESDEYYEKMFRSINGLV